MKRIKSSVNANNANNTFYGWVVRNLPSYRVLAILGWSLLAIDIILHHSNSTSAVNLQTPVHEITLPKDRSTTYNVKVLPSMDDDELELLPSSAFSYMAMIDAGSSGCRVHVYRYGKVKSQDGPLYIVPKHVSLKVKPGLSSFAKNPQDAGPSLKGLIDFVKSKVPDADLSSTPIWLKATAGLRMLPTKESDAVLDSVRNFLSDKANSPLLFRSTWARIIPGQEEGAFGWISYNYLKRIIGPKRNALDVVPYAVIEMGGASSQVTQLASAEKDIKDIPEDYKYVFTIEGATYTLYTHSYLGFGSEQAREGINKLLSKSVADGAVVKDPCLNKGYSRIETVAPSVYDGPNGKAVTGVSDEAASCSDLVKQLFKSPPDLKCPATVLAAQSFACTYQPKFVIDSLNFLVFENFYYVASGIGIQSSGHAEGAVPGPFPRVTSAKEMNDSAREVCGASWTQLQEKYPKDNSGKENNVKFCFTASLLSSFLVDGLGVDPNKQLTIQQSVGNSDIEWALGAAYKEAADFLKKDSLRGSGN